MKKIKNYTNWLNESEISHSIVSFFDTNWKEIKFPWEKEIEQKLHDIKNSIEDIENDFTQDRYETGTIDFDIKIRKSIDSEKISKEFDIDEESVNIYWHEFINQQLTNFVESLEYEWIEDCHQNGRSGGWLTLKIANSYTIERFKEVICDELDQYDIETEEYDPISDEQYKKIKRSDFGLVDVPEHIKTLIDEKKLLLSNLDGEYKSIESLKSDLLEIQKLIKISLDNIDKSFKEWLKDEIDEND